MTATGKIYQLTKEFLELRRQRKIAVNADLKQNCKSRLKGAKANERFTRLCTRVCEKT